MSFVEDNARGGGLRVLGRITYELMIQYWPTPAAAKANPVVAELYEQSAEDRVFENGEQAVVEQYTGCRRSSGRSAKPQEGIRTGHADHGERHDRLAIDPGARSAHAHKWNKPLFFSN